MTTRASELREAFDAEFAAAPRPVGPPRSDFLCIRVGDQPYALALADIAALHADLRIVALPARSPELLGVAGVRAQVIAIYDLGAVVGTPGAGATRWAVLLRHRLAGFAFSRVDRYARIPDGAIAVAIQRGHVRGRFNLDGQPYSIIDVAGVLTALEARWRGGDVAKDA